MSYDPRILAKVLALLDALVLARVRVRAEKVVADGFLIEPGTTYTAAGR